MSDTPGARRPVPVPVTVLTGFLGAGKTTILQRILPTLGPNEKVLTIVNDLSPDNTDVFAFRGETAALSGGCVCCNLLGELVTALIKAVEEDAYTYIFLECTGVADPAPVVATMAALPALKDKIIVDAVITVVHAAALAAAATTAGTTSKDKKSPGASGSMNLDASRLDAMCGRQILGSTVVLINNWECISPPLTPLVMRQWTDSIRSFGREANTDMRVYYTNSGCFAFADIVHRAGLFHSDANSLPYYLRVYAESGKVVGEGLGDDDKDAAQKEEAHELAQMNLKHFTFCSEDLVCSTRRLQEQFASRAGRRLLAGVWRSKGFFAAVDDVVNSNGEDAAAKKGKIVANANANNNVNSQCTQFRWQSVRRHFDYGEVLPPHVPLVDESSPPQQKALTCRIVFIGDFNLADKREEVDKFFAAVAVSP